MNLVRYQLLFNVHALKWQQIDIVNTQSFEFILTPLIFISIFPITSGGDFFSLVKHDIKINTISVWSLFYSTL